MNAGDIIGSYQVEKKLGEGGMGVVFLAYDTTLHRQVALKVVEASAEGDVSRGRLLREARNAAALNHPHICTVHEGDMQPSPFLRLIAPFRFLRLSE